MTYMTHLPNMIHLPNMTPGLSIFLIKINTGIVEYHLMTSPGHTSLSSKTHYMDVIHHSYATAVFAHERKRTIVQKFMAWCKTQEENRLLWLGVIILGHGCVLTPLTVFFVLSSGNSMLSWALVMTAMVMCLVTNLAALPMKITLPIFFLSVAIDLIVIIMAISHGLVFPGA